MEGGTTYHLVTDGIEAALEEPREAAGDEDILIHGGRATRVGRARTSPAIATMTWTRCPADGGHGEAVAEVLRSTGALLVGRRTQDVEDRPQPGFYGVAFSGPFFVLDTIPRPSLWS